MGTPEARLARPELLAFGYRSAGAELALSGWISTVRTRGTVAHSLIGLCANSSRPGGDTTAKLMVNPLDSQTVCATGKRSDGLSSIARRSAESACLDEWDHTSKSPASTVPSCDRARLAAQGCSCCCYSSI